MIISRTPYRISFAGGGTDFPAWFSENESRVVTATLNKYSFITCRKLDSFFSHNYRIVYSIIEAVKDIEEVNHPAVREIVKLLGIKGGLEIHHDGDLPARTGLGSSSAFTVGLIQVLFKMADNNISTSHLAELAIEVESQVLKENVGMQDQVSCAYGGINSMNFFFENGKPCFKVTPIIISEEKKKHLEGQIKLVYTGQQRYSSDVSQNLVSKFKSYSKETLKLQNRNVEMAYEIESILRDNSNLELISEIFNESWKNKEQLNPIAITPELRTIRNFGLKNGSTGAKLLGAGGGGFMAFWVPIENHKKFSTAFDKHVIVDIKFENEGSKIVYH